MQQTPPTPLPYSPAATTPPGAGRGVDDGADRYERVLRAIAAAAAPGPGSAAFFEELVRQIATGIGVRWAWIGEIAADAPARVTTLAMWGDGALQPPMTYLLDGTPCEHAMTTREGHHVARAVQQAFPRSAALVEMGAQSYYGVALRDERGAPRGMLTVIHDAVLEHSAALDSLVRTCAARAEGELARRRAEAALATREAQLAEAQRIAGLGSWTLDLRTRTVTWSAQKFRLLGYEPGEVEPTYEAFFARVHPDDVAGMSASMHRAIDAGSSTWTHEFRVRAPDDVERSIITRAELVRDEQGHPVWLHGTDQDVTEQRRLEAELRHAQKLDAVGRLAGGVAHDFNNLLTVITGTVDLIRDELGARHPAHEDVDRVAAAADRARILVRQLLAFSRRQVLQLRPLDLNACVRDAGRLLRRTVGEEVALVLALSPEPQVVRADAAQLEQVLLNLALNARDAIDGAGTLTLRTTTVERDGARHACLEVSDTGRGIAPGHRARLFEPFFTTKPLGEGSGLGLAMVYGIVSQLGGSVDVQSAEGEGTTFTIFLPRSDEAVPGAPAPAPAPEAPARTAVLLVEDESQVRATMRRMLERLGYAVHEAADGVEALERWPALRGEVRLVLTDVRMPRMGGRELARRLREASPALPIAFMSGYTDEGGDGLAVSAFLEKPVPMDRLRTVLRELVAA